MSRRLSTNRQKLDELLAENASNPTLVAELKAVEAILLQPRPRGVSALLKFLRPDLDHTTKWFITFVLEKVRDERIIRPMLRAAVAPKNEGYCANFLWPIVKYDCTKHLKFLVNLIVALPNPDESMMVAVMIIRGMKGHFEPALARSCVRKLLTEVKIPIEAEWKLQTEAFRLEAADVIMCKYYNQMQWTYWKPRNGSVKITETP